jgi:tetratricopeptide (TPR) repeat protein
MEPGAQRPGPVRDRSLAEAAAAVRTLDDLAALLRDLRRRHARSRRDSSLTYRELATKTGFSLTAIAEYFTARTLPPTDRFDAVLELLGATPAERRALATARDRIEEGGHQARARRAAPVPAKVPRQLPAAPHMFTGRGRELAFLDKDPDEAVAGALTVCAISGMGGIGKTTLALHWAHRNLDRFPDGQLYVNLRAFDPAGQPLTPLSVVHGFLEALGVPSAAIPVELDAQAALFRSLVAGRRMLIVADNARDTSQVAPLLPGGAACTVLITSRHQLTGLIAAHGARSMILDVLPDDDARQLLARHLDPARLAAEPDAAATLLACCAGLPLALSIVLARAATHPHLSLAALAGELSATVGRLDALDAGEPEADLRAVLSWSSHALSPDAARAFGLLGIAPGPDITLTAAASLLALAPAATRALLRGLDHANLIYRDAPERYRMHDLLRLHATEEARSRHTEDALREALQRLVAFYVHTACAGAGSHAAHGTAPALTGPPPGCVPQPLPDPDTMTAWLDSEHDNLLAAQEIAAGYGWHAEACALAWAMDPYYRRRGRLEEAATTWHRAVTSAQHLADQAVRAQAHQMLGDAWSQLGKTTEALHHLRQALALAERVGDARSLGEIHHSLGGAWERHGDDQRALKHAREALVIFRATGDAFCQGRVLNGVGWLQARLGEYAEARANCEQALALLRQEQSGKGRFGEAHALDSLGYIAFCRGDYTGAAGYYQQSLAIGRAHGHPTLEAAVLDHMAENYRAQRQFPQARDAWEQARDLYISQHRLAEAHRIQRHLDTLGPARYRPATGYRGHRGETGGLPARWQSLSSCVPLRLQRLRISAGPRRQ